MGWCHKGGVLSQVVGQHSSGEEESGKWHVCVDFMDLNKAYPKDPFPLPRIDQLVDAIA